ncbi:hypothetical protein PWT90_08485 [Aphanocladium album]|nr:hypothetical protein PWT90_08485 [Aphanocladium album]
MPNSQILPPRVGELEIYSQQLTDRRGIPSLSNLLLSPVEPDSKALESLIHKALCLHESPEGVAALTTIGVQVLQGLRTHTFGSRDQSEMRSHVLMFLQIVRRRFPRILITEQTQGDAATTRKTWGTDVDQYDSKNAADILVKKWILDGVVRSHPSRRQEPSRADNFKFHLIIALAHEIVHLFVGYLTGNSRVATPSRIAPPGERSGRIGESGRYWETTFLGGILEMRFPRGVARSSEPPVAYLGLGNASGTHLSRRISTNYINEFVTSRPHFPIRCASTEAAIPSSQLDIQYHSTPFRAAESNSESVGVMTRAQREDFRFRDSSGQFYGSSSSQQMSHGRYY